MDRVDDNTVAVSGELDKKCVVAVKDLKGETISIVNLGCEQVSAEQTRSSAEGDVLATCRDHSARSLSVCVGG